MIKNQENQENLIKDLEPKLDSLNNVSKTEIINMIRKSALLTEQFQKLIIKNKFGSNIYCKTRENSNYLKKGKIIISLKIQNFSRSRM